MMSDPWSAFSREANSRIRELARSSLEDKRRWLMPPLLVGSPGTTSFLAKTCLKNEALANPLAAISEIAPLQRPGHEKPAAYRPKSETASDRRGRAGPSACPTGDLAVTRDQIAFVAAKPSLEIGHIFEPDMKTQNRAFFWSLQNLPLVQVDVQRQARKAAPGIAKPEKREGRREMTAPSS
jgi:hypothetical protein